MSDYVLEIVEGPDAGKQVALDQTVEIGRDPGCTLRIDDEFASGHHARIGLRNGSVVAEDLDSTNGTFLNGMSLHGAAPMNFGDHLLIGVTVFELRTRRDVVSHGTAVRPRPAFAVEPARPNYIPAAADLPDPRLQKHRLDPLLDVRTKSRARIAPLGIALLVTFAIILYLAVR